MRKRHFIRPGSLFGKLRVIRYCGVRKRHFVWLCRCKCGVVKEMLADNLVRASSCGCNRRESIKTHGLRRAPEYMVWWAMLSRCYRKNTKGFDRYGGRGIRVCDRWRKSFSRFIEDMGRRPSPKHSIERIDDNGNYEPGNCCWATRHQQNRNTRRNRMIVYKGTLLCASDWAARLGMKAGTLLQRLKSGWSIDRAFNCPIRERPSCPSKERRVGRES